MIFTTIIFLKKKNKIVIPSRYVDIHKYFKKLN